MGEKGTPPSHSSHSSSAPLTLEEVERLPFYPLDPRLPPTVRLKLQCKELNFLIHKLQESLVVKMVEEQTVSQSDLLRRARAQRQGDEEWLADFTRQQGMERQKDGRIVPKKEKGE